MSTKLAIATLALFTAIVGPAFAGDQDTATLLQDSGRYVPQANLPEWNAHTITTHAYASAYASARPMRGETVRFVAPAPMVLANGPASDFQLQGR